MLPGEIGARFSEGKTMNLPHILYAIFTLAFLGQFSPTTNAKEPGRPLNLVLIVSDDQGWTDFGFMGHDSVSTPHLDRLASESLVFTRGYVPSSLCRPSLATILTGQFPHAHKVSGNDPEFRAKPAQKRKDPEYRRLNETLTQNFLKYPNLMQILGKQGYRSLQTGKWWEGDPKECGFTETMSSGDPDHGGRHGDEGLKIGREGIEPIKSFITESDEQPFFVWYAPMMPHDPHTPPERLLSHYSKGRTPYIAKYLAMCEWFDETVGELLSFLDETGHRDDTMVVFIVDNGWIQQENGKGFTNRSKRSPYDGGLRTPIMIRMPGVKPLKSTALASSVDLAPTILSALKIDYQTENYPGINLLDYTSEESLRPTRNAIYGEVFEHDIADVNDPSKSLMYQWVIREDMKLIQPSDQSEPALLFNVVKDPFETKDLANSQPQVVKELQSLLPEFWRR